MSAHAKTDAGRGRLAIRGLDTFVSAATFAGVRRLHTFSALLLLVLWLPATLHCRLEAAGLEHVFDCDVDHHSPASPAPADVARDACDVVENGWLKIAGPAIALPLPAPCACLLCFLIVPTVLPLQPPLDGLAEHLAAPREIARTWHFVVRAAPPARAPSVAS